MTELLFHQGEIDICRNQMTGNRMFESVGVPLFCWHPGFTGNRPKQPEKLRAIKSSNADVSLSFPITRPRTLKKTGLVSNI